MKKILKNGLVYNGENISPKKCDILINNEIIEKIEENIDDLDAEIIDCTNKIVTPGFIDAHSHNDFFVYNKNSKQYFEPFLKQGITTQVVGNCGFSSYTIDKDSKYLDLIGGGLFRSNKYSPLKEWTEEVKDNLYVNIIPLIGHGSARCSVSGYKADRLTQRELAAMLKLIEEDLKAGAFGGSLGLMYEPGMYADEKELVEFAKLLKQYDGILTVHPRACSNVSMGFPLLKPHHLELGLEEVVNVLKKTNVRCEYSHLIFTGKKSWGRLNSMVNKFHQLRKIGYEIGYDMYPYTYGCSVISVLLPSYYLALPKDERQKGLIPFKTKLLLSISKLVVGIGFEDLKVSFISDEHPEYEGLSIAEIAKKEKMSNVNTYLKLVELSDGKGRITMDKYYNEKMIKTLMKDEISIFMTDAWYEEKGMQNGSTYTAFPKFILNSFKYNIPLEKVIYKMTGSTADRFHLKNRGYIKEGYYADFVIFDKNELEVSNDTNLKGISYVFVNGEKIVQNDKFLDIKKGQVILKKYKN